MVTTKKDFIAIAGILNKKILLHKNNNSNKVLVLKQIANELGDYFASQNPQFNADTFAEAVLKGVY